MINDRDKKSVLYQINNLKLCSDKMRENLGAIQLLMIDNNYGRTKDPSVSDELAQLIRQVESMSNSIDSMEKRLM